MALSIKASPTNDYADLFWALRGGGNSFALVTDLELKTYDVPVVTVGITAHGNTTKSSIYYDTLVDYALEGQTDDVKASIIPVVNSGNTAMHAGSVSFVTYRFWGDNATETYGSDSPPSLAYFTEPKLPVISDSFAPKSMHQWDEENAPPFAVIKGLRQRFYAPLSLRVVDKKQAVAALEIIHEEYFGAVFDALEELDLWFTGMSPFPVSKNFLAASTGPNYSADDLDNPSGDPMGVTPENLIVVELSLSYSDNSSYEPIATEFLHGIGRKIRDRLCQDGLEDLISPYLYLNDADKGQDVFAGYPDENVKALQLIREKYDPERVFTDLMPGGWKVAAA